MYVEKFDSSNAELNLSVSDWDDIRAGIFKTYMDSPDNHKLKNDCKKRLYNGKFMILFTKSEFAQNFVIQTINDKLKLPGIMARGPHL